MCNKYINLQTGEELDLDKVGKLKDNAMLKVKPELWVEWDFEKNSELDIWKMTKGSDRKVWWECSKCKSSYDSVIHPRCKTSSCPYCRGLKVNHTNSLASKNPELTKEWNYEENGELTPHDVTCNSGLKVWWLGKCGHRWDARITDRNKGRGCPYCCHNSKVLKGYNDLWTTHEYIASLLVNSEDGYKYTYGSSKGVNFRCFCGEIINEKVNRVITRGLSCILCKDGISFGEKVVYILLNELRVPFIKEYIPDWLPNKRYDFYIEDLSCIIEVMGSQHYVENGFNGKLSLLEITENDARKKRKALSNAIKYYIELDTRESNIEYIKESILNSQLSSLWNLNNICWKSIFLKATKSLIIDVCGYYKNEEINITKISEKFSISVTTVIKYLKRGNDLGLCEYTPFGEIGKKSIKESLAIPVIQFDLDGNMIERHDSIRDAANKIGCANPSQISDVCKSDKLNKSALGYMWLYESDFEKGVLPSKYSRNDSIPVVQLSLEGEFIKEYPSIYEAHKDSKATQNGIKMTCEKVYSKANNYIWVYKHEYDSGEFQIREVFNREKKIVQLDKNNKLINTWKSIRSASNELRCSYSSISAVLYGKALTGAGYKWMYEYDYIECLQGKKSFPRTKRREIIQLTKNNNFIKMFPSLTAIESELNISKSNIVRAAKSKLTSGGYKWMYLEDYEKEYGEITE